MNAFTIHATDEQSSARAGVLKTAHGEIETPIFMPVGTVGSVKGVHIEELKSAIEAQIILGNTYHLYLRPGLEVLQEAGGLHQFMNWDGPILTDSGGFQVYSLSHRRDIKEEGVNFKSHIDGSTHFFSPEGVMDIQRVIGADIIMAFDECTPYPCEYGYAKNSMEMTHRWLKRCISHFSQTEPLYDYHQILSPIVQGSTYKDLRVASAKFIADQDAPMNAIGGLSVGEPHEEMYEMTGLVCEHLPKDKPRYLMGVGKPENIIESIALGVDMFDCVLPTRNARHGMIYTSHGVMNIKNAKFKKDFTVIDDQVASIPSQTHTRAYLHHLFRSGELLGGQIASLQNLSFYLWLVKTARKEILAGTFSTWKAHILPIITQRL